MAETNTGAPGTNDKVLFWASFMTLIAAGMGFSIRGAILFDWGKQFGFTQTELGWIQGAGGWGFPVAIISLSLVVDRLGYGPLMVLAFLLHFASGVVTLAATFAFDNYGKEYAYNCLYWGTLLFSLANGTCEAVINPLTATLFPKNKTHWLNILHAGWPGGLVLGALLGLLFENVIKGMSWEIQLGMFLVPTLIYGGLMIGRRFPHSEAKVAGVSVGTMLLEFASPILLFLIVLHAMVGYVELGTDSWIQNITVNIMENKNLALFAFFWTNVLMFSLRFFAGPIVHRISPLGLLFFSAILGAIGLTLLGQSGTAWAWLGAVTVYGIGKTFFWPTMLGVVSERFPKGGAITLGVVGGVGMLSAGFLGAPGIGYEQDYFATQYLKEESPGAYARYKAATPDAFLFFPAISGLDQAKVGILLGEPGKNNGNGKILKEDIQALEKSKRKLADDKPLEQRYEWWESVEKYEKKDKEPIEKARLHGGKAALSLTAAVPAAMAVGYLILIIFFRLRGGYKAEVLIGHAAQDEEFTGGTEGPGEG
jgi:MFS family permease